MTPLSIAVLTVSDTRTEETDKSGAVLIECLQAAGHKLHSKTIVKDDIYQLRAEVSAHIFNPEVHVLLLTGGTGFTVRDNTFEAIKPLFDVDIEGFGELFRQLSYEEIGTSTIQSRAFAGAGKCQHNLLHTRLSGCLPHRLEPHHRRAIRQ